MRSIQGVQLVVVSATVTLDLRWLQLVRRDGCDARNAYFVNETVRQGLIESEASGFWRGPPVIRPRSHTSVLQQFGCGPSPKSIAADQMY